MSIGRDPSRAWAAVAVAVALSLVAVLPASQALGASPTACKVRNVKTGVTKPTLRAAVRAARPGHRLTVQGRCFGRTVVGKNLTITGIRRGRSGIPQLDANDTGTVVKIKAGRTVRINSLHILDGKHFFMGGGIDNAGRLFLKNVVVRGNEAGESGGGIVNQRDATLVLQGNTAIRHNKARFGAGLDDRGGTVKMWGTSSIRNNTASNNSGGATIGSLGHLGHFDMNDSSSIRNNTAAGSNGGVGVSGAALVMNDSSSIKDNVAGARGGGVDIWEEPPSGVVSSLTMNHSSVISGNKAGTSGGGVASAGPVTLNGSSSIRNNDAIVGDGGGVYLYNQTGPSVTMNGSSSITGNTAGDSGGGIYSSTPNGSSSVTMTGSSSITGNHATQGGGLLNLGSTSGVVCAPTGGANIHSNTVDDCWGS